MLRELSIKAKRRARENAKLDSLSNSTPVTNINLENSSTSLSSSISKLSTLSSVTQASDESIKQSSSSEAKLSRGLSSLPRRLSRGTGSFITSSSAAARARRVTNVEKDSDSNLQQQQQSTVSAILKAAAERRASHSHNKSQVVHRLRRRSSATSKSSSPEKQNRSPPRLLKRSGITNPLNSVDELLKWRPTGSAAKCVSSVPLSEAAIKRYVRSGTVMPSLPTPNLNNSSIPPLSSGRSSTHSLKRLQPPRLLLCHDFKGGYQPWEAAAAGVTGDDCPENNQIWRFNHWAYVDIFVYFSHNCVSIPPVGYIHAAHRHGSLVLGTLIFEWENGSKEIQKILTSFKTRAKAASQLAAIAKFYGFDGWLINVECQLGSSAAASDLAAFVGDLTRTTRKVIGQASEVIWYDSVIRDGSLSYQNELNTDNEQFFKAAGSIFTNYHWDRNAPVRSAVKAGTRRTNVFTGIDIHGRKTFGGGGFHTHLALRAIKQGGTSAAIFAPAWTVESCPPNISDPRELEERFWTGPSGKFGRESVAQYFQERPVITDLPFSTNFDPGWGPHTVRNGTIKDRRRYFNMSQQQVQPSFMRPVVASGDGSTVDLCQSHNYAYNGSTAIKTSFQFSDSRMLSGSYAILRLFVSSLAFPGRISSRLNKTPEAGIKISYHYRAEGGTDPMDTATDFGLVLVTSSPPSAILLVSKSSRWAEQGGPRRAVPRLQIQGKFMNVEICTPTSDKRALGARSDEDDSTGWMTRTFTIDSNLISGQKVTDIMIIVGTPPEQPVSVRPSPFMTPSLSRMASRPLSRVLSRNTSRLGSRIGSRANSPPRDRREEENSRLDRQRFEEQTMNREDYNMSMHNEKDRFGSGLLQQYRESFAQRARTEVPNRANFPMSQHGKGFGTTAFERRQESAPGIFQRTDANQGGFSRRFQARTEMESREMMRRGDYGNRDGDDYRAYASNFQIGGTIDYDQLDNDLSFGSLSTISQRSSRFATPSLSRPVSRFGSRAGSMNGSAMGSLSASLAASRTGSVANSRGPSLMNSRAGSRAGSRLGSRFASPSRTPSGGGGGAVPLSDAYGRRMSSARQTSGGSSSSLRLMQAKEIETDTESTNGKSSAALSELKSVLMTAAVSMAGEETEVIGPDGQIGNAMKIVYLGGLKIEQMTVEQPSCNKPEAEKNEPNEE